MTLTPEFCPLAQSARIDVPGAWIHAGPLMATSLGEKLETLDKLKMTKGKSCD